MLDITSDLPNGVARSQGFADGLRAVLGDRMDVLTVDGRDLYSAAYEVARDALRMHPEINVLFGVNDDLILGGIQAALDLGCDPERAGRRQRGRRGQDHFRAYAAHSPLVACLALFPEVVGRTGIEAMVRLWAGEDIGGEFITPMRHHHGGQPGAVLQRPNWTLDLDAVRRLRQTQLGNAASRCPAQARLVRDPTSAPTSGIRTSPEPCRNAPARSASS